jgi:malate dehydrogenase (oxaloacetate-decarboxylating)(NADP+)
LDQLTFGVSYILPKLIDQRLKVRVSEAVAKAAIVSGVASDHFSTNKHA